MGGALLRSLIGLQPRSRLHSRHASPQRGALTAGDCRPTIRPRPTDSPAGGPRVPRPSGPPTDSPAGERRDAQNTY
jgi:hypothetical protein